jgi:hypothetical protein
MNNYFIPNQQTSSFTIHRRYVVSIYNQWTNHLNNGKNESERTPIITENDIPNRSELIQFVKNFNKQFKK